MELFASVPSSSSAHSAASKSSSKSSVNDLAVKALSSSSSSLPSGGVSSSSSAAAAAGSGGGGGGVYSFADAGLCDWLCQNVAAIGYKKPTDIQAACIPAILEGHDVLACAQTGSGKTAAFALPILQKLSEDPYGIYAIVLTPTRELAMQIADQISAFGNSFGVRTTLIIGGVNMVEQSLMLSKRPHFVIATPGRFRHHLESAAPPDISRAEYLVLDEADRLLAGGFEDELEVIIERMGPKRKTLLFSATLTSSLVELEQLALKDALRFDLTSEYRIPERLVQQYLFMPPQIKMCYLVAVLRKLAAVAEEEAQSALDELGGGGAKNKKMDAKAEAIRALLEDSVSGGGKGGGKKQHHNNKKGSGKKKGTKSGGDDEVAELPFSLIIFVGNCRRCQELSEMLKELNIDNVSLNGLLSQTVRSSSLAKFKNQSCKVLIATDVASRGLDIPSVDMVINFDLPKICSDYVHRAGRTARAGRGGRCLSLLTQYDIDVLHAIEEFTGQKLALSTEVSEEDIPPLLNPISKAMRLAKMKLMDNGTEEKLEVFNQRKRKQKKQILRKHRQSANEVVDSSTGVADTDSATDGKKKKKRKAEGDNKQ